MLNFKLGRKPRPKDGPEYADSLKLLADKAFPDLKNKVREYMALTHFLGKLDHPQEAFSVRQKRPTTFIGAVSATIEMESYLRAKPSSNGQIRPVQSGTETVIATVQCQQNIIMGI